MDQFDTVNLNRQAGANAATIGRPKLDVMAEMALAINPSLNLRRFHTGLVESNLDDFLDGVDLFVDGLDFFAFHIREQVFARANERGIPAITAAPIGMGTGFLAFQPGGQTFEQYFHMAGHSDEEKSLRFLMGVAPAGLHRRYLVDDSYVDLKNKRGPSTAAACELCAGMAATQALKILLNRGDVPYAPNHLTFDAYRCRLVRTRLRWGVAGPLQRLKRAIARRIYAGMARQQPVSPPQTPQNELEAILDSARWAPSGDNGQPWHLETIGEDAVRVHLTPDAANPYEYRAGQPVWLAGGMLLQCLKIAATAYGRSLQWSLPPDRPWTIEAEFPRDPTVCPSPMLPYLFTRSVARRALGTAPLSPAEQAALAASLEGDLAIEWFHRPAERLRFARLGALATDIRLRAAETFEVHRRAIDWTGRDSPAGMPAASIGLNRLTRYAMRWAMQNWDRTRRMNRLLGTRAASAQLDLLPGLRSAAFFVLRSTSGGTISDSDPAFLLRSGMAIQRLWLVAAQMRLGMQPALATLIFAHLGAAGVQFTADASLCNRASVLGEKLQRIAGPVDRILFIARLGRLSPGLPLRRSVRRSLSQLRADRSLDPISGRPS